MAGQRSSEVNLIISATNRAKPAFDSINSELDRLLSTTEGGAARVKLLTDALSRVDKSAGTISSAADKGEQAFARLTTKVDEQRAKLKLLEDEAADAARALALLNSPDAVVNAGRDQTARINQVRELEKRFDSLVVSIGQSRDKITAFENALSASRSSLQQISSITSAAGDAQQKLRADIAAANNELSQQQAQAARTAQAQQTLRNILASQYQDSGYSAEGSAIAFMRAGPTSTERQIERDANAQRDAEAATQKRIAAERELNNQLAERAQIEATLERTTGLGRTPATQNGASFSALAAAARAAEEQAAAVEKLRAALNPASVIQKQFNDQIREAIALRRQDLITTEELGKRIAQLREQSTTRRAAVDPALKAAADKAAEAAANERELAAAADRVRTALNPQAAIKRQFNDQIREAIRLYRAEQLSVDELRQRIGQLRALEARAQVDLKRNGGSGIGIFGLRPYEVTNLGYQVNDLITQVASGTSVTQALAQQGGQILQILPQIGSGLLGLIRNPFFLTAGAILTTIALGFQELNAEVDRTRTLTRDLGLNVDGGVYDPAQLNKAAEALDRYGMSASDATDAVRTFVKEGVDPSQIEAFGRTANDLAEILGGDVTDAVKIVAEAFTGNYESIRELDKQYNFLTAAQLSRIKTLFEEGNAQQALKEAYDIFAARAQKTADDSRGPWAAAFRELGGAWQEFKNYISELTPIKAAASALENLAGIAKTAIAAMRGANNISDLTAQVERIRGQVDAARQAAASDPSNINRIQLLDRERALAHAERMLRLAQEKASVETDSAEKQAAAAAQQARTIAEQAERTKKDNDRAKEAIRLGNEKATVEKAVADARKTATEFAEKEFRYADAATKQRYIQQQIDKARGDAQKKIADEAERERKERERAAEQRIREGSTPQGAARNLIMEREDFRARAYWDVNAYRVGYGSDTVTNPDGSVSRVTANTRTTETAALADLERRIGEFQDTIKRQIGSERFGAFNAQQQAALTSVAYNYGSLPDRILAAVKNGNAESIAAAIRSLGGDNGGVNRRRRNREADLFTAGPSPELDAFNENAAQEKLDKQTEFNQALDAEARKRELSIELAEQQRGLTGEALIDAQKRASIEEAVRREREKALKDETTYTAEQETRTRALAAQEFELTRGIKERAQARRADVDQPVDLLRGQADQIRNQIRFLREGGNNAEANALLPQLDAVNAKLREAIQNAIAFYRSLTPGSNDLGLTEAQIQGIITQLEGGLQIAKQWGTVLGVDLQQIAQTFASTVTSAFDKFIRSVVEGENAFKAAKTAFLDFAANFLRMIAQMILQQIAFNIARGLLGSFGLPVGTNHSGGIAGINRTETRTVSPEWFSAASRYHTGGIAGLKPNEVPAILEKGEEVLTRADPRHRMNGGGQSGGGAMNLKNVVVFDREAAAQEILRSPAGERAMLTFLSENRDAVQGALGG